MNKLFAIFTAIALLSAVITGGSYEESAGFQSQTTSQATTPIPGTEPVKGILRTIKVSTVADIRAAVENALPGDEIVVTGGEYEVENVYWNQRAAAIRTHNRSGTAQNPIVLRSENPHEPAHFRSADITVGTVLHIWESDYWIIQDLEIEGGQKGVIFDNSNYSIMRGCHVFGIGQEAVHFRDGSSDNIVVSNKITNTGLHDARYGEGIYVGSFEDVTAYSLACNNNVISHNVLGPGIAAEPVDIKGGTYGTIVEYNIMYGEGVTGANSSTCLIKNGGNDTIIRFNSFYRDGNKVLRAIVENWALYKTMESGQRNQVYGNTFHLDNEAAYRPVGTWLAPPENRWSLPENQHHEPFSPARPVFAVGAWTDSASMYNGDVHVGENTLIEPFTGQTTFNIVHNFSPGVLTVIDSHPSIDPNRDIGLLSHRPWNEPIPDNLIIRIITVGDYDVIEIHNPTDRVISTKGLFLSNDYSEPFLWQMPSVVVRAGEDVLFASESDDVTKVLKRYRVGFEVAANNPVWLFEGNGECFC